MNIKRIDIETNAKNPCAVCGREMVGSPEWDGDCPVCNGCARGSAAEDFRLEVVRGSGAKYGRAKCNE